jgi:hypothetical protein
LAWFRARKKSSYEVKDTHLRLAEQIWKRRTQSASPGLKLAGDLGAAVRSTPEHAIWKTIKLAIYSEDFSADGKKRMKEDQHNNPVLKGFDSYEDSQDVIHAGDWILDFWLGKKVTRFGGYWSVPNPKFENELLTYVQQKPHVMLPGFGMLELSADDLSDLEMVALVIAQSRDASNPPSAMVPIRDAIAFIDKRRDANNNRPPDIRAFERAMRDIFTEATKIGYWPTEFLRMVDREGPLPTAKRLIMSTTPSSGFTRLWELERLDLTVEALALREPWRRLFTEVELKKARQRLDQLNYKSEP